MANKLTFIYGAMGSSKTLRLLVTAYNFQEKNIHFICLKPAIDDRDGVGIIHSRVGIERKCQVVSKDDNLYAIIKAEKEKDPELKKVLVDECQFLTALQVRTLAKAVDEFSIDAMCYGLRTDFKGELFEGSKALFEWADTIEEVKSHCDCGNKAIMNARFDADGFLVLGGAQIQIGGNELYRPLCRKCYNEASQKSMEHYVEMHREKINNLLNNSKNEASN